MTYEAYELRILKIQRILNFLRKNKILLLSIMAVLLVLLVAFLSTKGILLEDYSLDKSDFVFGEAPTPSGRALFSSVSFEYSADGGRTWSEEEPIFPGEYRIRAVANRSFGAKSYGEEQVYRIEARPITLSLEEQSVVYGDLPTVSADGLLAGTRVDTLKVTYKTPYTLGEVDVVIDGLRLTDRDGNDVTSGYSFTLIDGTVTVTARPLTVTVESLSRPYDGTPLTNEEYATGGTVAEGDVLTLSFPGNLTAPGTADNTPTVLLKNAAGEDVTACYAVTVPEATLTVTRRPLSVTLSSADKVYDGLPLEATSEFSGLADGQTVAFLYAMHSTLGLFEDFEDESYAFSRVSGSATYSVTGITVKDSDGNDVTDYYEIAPSPTATLSITRRPLSVTLSSAEKVYDGLPLEATSEFSGLADGQTVAFLYAMHSTLGRFDDFKEESYTFSDVAGSAAYSVTDIAVKDGDGNDVTDCYAIAPSPTATLSITRRPVSVTVGSITDHIYDATAIHATHTVLGAAEGQTLHVSYLVDDTSMTVCSIKNVAESLARLPATVTHITDEDGTEIAMDNYTISVTPGALVVLPRPVTVTVGSITDHVYDATAIHATHTVLGAVEGQTLHVSYRVGNELMTAYSAKNVVDSLTAIHPFVTGISDGDGAEIDMQNYDITPVDGALVVLPRPVTVTVGSITDHVYDASAIHATHTVLGAVEGQTLHVSYRVGNELMTAYSAKNVADSRRSIAPTVTHITDKGGAAIDMQNYDITPVDGALVILPRPVSISSEDDTQVYNGKHLTNSGYTVTSGSAAPGERLIIATTGSIIDVGDEVNTLSVSIENGILDNYDIQKDEGTLTVTERPLTITVKDLSKVYDGYALTPEYLLNEGEDIGLAEGESISAIRFSVSSRTFAGRDPVAILRDSVVITAARGNTTKNYTLSFVDGSLSIDKRPIKITTGSGSKVYDATPLLGASYPASHEEFSDTGRGLAVTDTISFSNYAKRTNVFDPDQNSVTVTIMNGSEEATGSYAFEEDFGTLTIEKRPLTVTVSTLSKIYDAAPLLAERTYTPMGIGIGLVDGQSLDVEYSTAAITNVAESCTVTVATRDGKPLITILSGSTDVTENYAIETVSGSLTVDRRPLTVDIDENQMVYNDTKLSASHAYTPMSFGSGLLDSQSLTVQYSTSAIVNVAESCTVTVAEQDGKPLVTILSGSTDVTDNYEITCLPGSLTVTPRPLVLETVGGHKTYDGLALLAGYRYDSSDSSGLLSHHDLQLSYSIPSILNAWESMTDGAPTATLIVEGSWAITNKETGDNVLENYAVSRTDTPATLTVDPRPVTITVKDLSAIYSGGVLSAAMEIERASGTGNRGLLTGHGWDARFVVDDTRYTEYGIVNRWESLTGIGAEIVSVTDADGNTALGGHAMTENYAFDYVLGSLEIEPRPVTVTVNKVETVYDSLFHSAGYSVEEESSTAERGLLGVHTADVRYIIGSERPTAYGIYDTWDSIATLDVEVVGVSGGVGITAEQMLENYAFETVTGSLVIKKLSLSGITIDLPEIRVVYDDEYHFFTREDIVNYDEFLAALAENDKDFSVVFNDVDGFRDVSDTPMSNNVRITSLKILSTDRVDGSGDPLDVTDNYEGLTLSAGTIKILPRPLTVQIVQSEGDAGNGKMAYSKIFDDLPLNATAVVDVTPPTEDGAYGLVAGHDWYRLTYTVPDGITDVLFSGSTVSFVTQSLILEGCQIYKPGADNRYALIGNYDITVIDCTLQIDPITLTLESATFEGDTSKTYDGTPYGNGTTLGLTKEAYDELMAILGPSFTAEIRTVATTRTDTTYEKTYDALRDRVDATSSLTDEFTRGTVANAFEHYAFYSNTRTDEYGNRLDVTDNFVITTEEGTLEIKPYATTVSIYFRNQKFSYTGFEIITSAYFGKAPTTGHTLFASFSGYYVTDGAVPAIDTVTALEILDATGTPATQNYCLKYGTQSINVWQRFLKVKITGNTYQVIEGVKDETSGSYLGYGDTATVVDGKLSIIHTYPDGSREDVTERYYDVTYE